MPYLREAFAAGDFDLATASAVRALPVVREVRPAPPRSRVASIGDQFPRLKRAVRPITDLPAVLATAKRVGVVQDVYDPEDDTVVAVHRAADRCGDCRRCEDVCPDGLPLDRIGAQDCTGCLYCWWVCPKDAISLEGDPGFLARHAERYKQAIERL